MNFPIIGAMPVAISTADSKAVHEAEKGMDDVRLTNAELMKLAGWTADDFTAVRTQHALPLADGTRVANGNFLSHDGEPIRLRRLVKAWAREQEQLAFEKLPLVKRLL